jgi:flap endonuclease-1
MGIQHLNAYFKKHARSESIKKMLFKDLKNRVIAIDASIYLYRFLAEDSLLENIYSMVALMKHYGIIPIFVFDGKAPIEKHKLLEKRNQDKNAAEKKYNELSESLANIKDDQSKIELEEYIYSLKRKFVRLKWTDVRTVQQLLTAFGITYLVADGEADVLCAQLVLKRRAYACLSEDMDLFLYGCPRVLRYLSLMNETMVMYDLEKILKDINLTLTEFKEICILSGTDYNYGSNCAITLYQTLGYFKQYKRILEIDKTINQDFYSWVDDKYKCIENIYELYNIFHMFRTDNTICPALGSMRINKKADMITIKKIMEPIGFIFVDRDMI